jgi:hypothetical protein
MFKDLPREFGGIPLLYAREFAWTSGFRRQTRDAKVAPLPSMQYNRFSKCEREAADCTYWRESLLWS